MPATSFTKVVAVNFADGIADVGFEAVDQPNNNDFVNTGNTVLLIANGSGGAVNVTFPTLPASKFTVNDPLTKTPSGGVVAAGDTALLGPFPTAIYGATVNVAYDTGTSITAAVIELEKTPL